MFLLVSCLFAFEYLLCFMHGQGQRTNDTAYGEQKHITKKLAMGDMYTFMDDEYYIYGWYNIYG